MKKLNNLSRTGIFLILIAAMTFFAANGFNFSDNSSKQLNGDNQKFSQVRIFATSQNDIDKMLNAGLFIDHANSKPGLYMDTWLSENEIESLKKSGVPYQVLVDDWMEYYNSLPKMTASEMDAQMQQVFERDNISHSIFGSMGGYMTYTEVVAKLDSMRMWYPQFISQKFSIGTTYENRTMWGVRITHNPDAPTGRPQALYHAVIHAREPESMETQFYYFFWLFENYNTNYYARYILDNREIYWMPIFNPDGYVYNQTTNPNGGGMWRCNRHFTTGNCGPVDLNRNFGLYAYWNSTNGGSSTNECAGGQGTYRGASPFSELENLAVYNFVNSHNFNSSFGAHTYGNYLIKPWCWSDPNPTPDDAKFNVFLADLKFSNPVYLTGPPSQTVGYYVRGGADDWYYNDSVHTGHHIMAITPESDESTFWPSQNQIIPLAQGMLFNNTYMSLIAGPFVDFVSGNTNQASYTLGSSGTYRVRFLNKGALTANNTHIILTPANSNLTITNQQYSFNVGVFQKDSATFNFTVSSGAANNCNLPAFLIFKQDTATIFTMPVYVQVGTPPGTVVLNDDGSSFSNWITTGITGTWNTSTTQYHTPPSSFADSPTGNYSNGADNTMTLANPINVSVQPVVTLSFWHRYALEANYDWVMVEVSSNNGDTWQTVTEYTGTNTTWTQQTFDITRYANASTQMKVRFRLVADAGSVADGWYVDDIVITTYCTGTITGITGNNNSPFIFALQQNYPNPFNPVTVIKYQLPNAEKVSIKVFDILGKEVATLVNENKQPGYYEVSFDATNFASGLYFYRIEAGSFVETKKMMLIK
jgi:murein tripeptide amidase MpaA